MSPKDELMHRESDEFQFTEFLKQLVAAGCVENAAFGITKIVIDKGRHALRGDQERTFQKYVIGKFVHKKCKKCEGAIPWYNMFSAIESGMCVDHNPDLRSDKE